MTIYKKIIRLDNDETIHCARTEIQPNLHNILFIHGNFSSSLNWWPTMQALNKQFNTYAFDLRGFGESSYQTKITSLKDFAEDSILLFDQLELTDLTIVGWSTGGAVALEIARIRPDLVKQIVLLSSVGLKGYDLIAGFPANTSMFSWNIPSFFNQGFSFVDSVSQLSMQHFIFQPLVIKQFLNQYLYHQQAVNPLYEQQLIDQIMKQRNFSELLQALMQYNFKAFSTTSSYDATFYTGPIHIWHGALDRVIPLATAQQTANYFGKQGNLLVFKESGHAIMHDESDHFIEELRRIAGPVS